MLSGAMNDVLILKRCACVFCLFAINFEAAKILRFSKSKKFAIPFLLLSKTKIKENWKFRNS